MRFIVQHIEAKAAVCPCLVAPASEPETSGSRANSRHKAMSPPQGGDIFKLSILPRHSDAFAVGFGATVL